MTFCFGQKCGLVIAVEGIHGIDNTRDTIVPSKKDTIYVYGKIHDTGALNQFTVYIFENNEIFSCTYQLGKRIYLNESGENLIKLKGTFRENRKVDGCDYTVLEDTEKEIEKAKHKCLKAVKRLRKKCDLNIYKETEIFKHRFGKYKNFDLNVLKFKEEISIEFFDFSKMLVGIHCGKLIIDETQLRGDYISFIAVYDLNTKQLQKVLLKNTGYFRE